MVDNNQGSAPAGSPIGNGVPNPNMMGGAPQGQTPAVTPQIDPAQHAELESLVGRQGQELGEYRKFYNEIAPLLEKLDKSPEIVHAILGGQLTPDLAKAAMEGKVKIEDAQIVSKAQEIVRKDLGAAAYAGASPEEITKMIEAKAQEIKAGFEKDLKERDEIAEFDKEVNEFITRTPDFGKYASDIDKWLDEHDVTDIAVAYYAVKGELSEKEAKKQADIDSANHQKDLAMGVGGASRATFIRNDDNVIDQLIGTKSNPNNFS